MNLQFTCHYLRSEIYFPFPALRYRTFLEYFENKMSRVLYSFSHLLRFILIFKVKDYRWYREGNGNPLNTWIKRLSFENEAEV